MKNRTHGEKLNKMELFGLKKNVKKINLRILKQRQNFHWKGLKSFIYSMRTLDIKHCVCVCLFVYIDDKCGPTLTT